MSDGESTATGLGPSEQDRKNRRVAIVAVAAVVVLVLVAFATGALDGGPSERDARVACEGFADERLKAPATADYNLTATESGNGWNVTGTVDSENGFGAKVRSDIICQLHFDSDTAVLDQISVG